MSKHYFKSVTADGLLQAQLGWDKPMQMFYCVILKFEDEEVDSLDTWEEPIYSNLNEPPQPLEYYLSVCKRLGIDIPSEMIDAILVDKHYNVVNEVRYWN